MEQFKNSICVTSYNSTGFGVNAQHFMETLLLFSNILCIQEHFLQDFGDKKYSNTNKLRRKYSNHDMYIVPAYKKDNRVCRGRGKGGLATIWEKGLTKYVSKLKCKSFRLQGTKFSFPSGTLVVINTYFPCDPRTNEFDDSELMNVLAEIQYLIENSNTSSVLLAGDLNCHFNRNTRFTNIVKHFFDEKGLQVFWDTPNDRIEIPDYTHLSSSGGSLAISTIDHFVGSHQFLSALEEAGVVHDAGNTSNHSPIYAKFNVGNLNVETEQPKCIKRTKWDKATDIAKDNYKDLVSGKLEQIILPDCVNCINLHCMEHAEQLELYTMAVLEAVETAAQESLPSVGGGSSRADGGCGRYGRWAGWTEYVKPYYEESKFWRSIWQSAGQPSQGDLFDMMHSTKSQYKYAIRRLKRAKDKIENDKFVNSIISGGVNIFDEIKRFRGKVKTCSSRIDDEVGSGNIANHFAGIYSELYNRVEQDRELKNLQDELDNKVQAGDMFEVNRVTEDVVKQALARMKTGKNDSIYDFQSDCLTEGPPGLVTHLTHLIRSFLIHGQVPYFLLVCTLLPLVKDNLGDITQSDNYRAIASGSQILKLLDIIILILEGDKFGCDQLQFGFQAKSSTSMCSWGITSVIDYYNRQGSVVYGCAMDLSKAFDMVEWIKLFKVLVERNVSPIFLRTLLWIYSSQSCDVRWNGSSSSKFSVSNGVHQGASLFTNFDCLRYFLDTF